MKSGARVNGPASLKLTHNTAVPAHLRGGLMEVSHVLTPVAERGKGHAGRLMAAVCQEADAASKMLLIRPQPFDIPELTRDQLTDWYRGFGFDVLQDEPVRLLVRKPHAAPRLKMKQLACAMREN